MGRREAPRYRLATTLILTGRCPLYQEMLLSRRPVPLAVILSGAKDLQGLSLGSDPSSRLLMPNGAARLRSSE
jgi:hypothetical protein